jgi:hypothetical protein
MKAKYWFGAAFTLAIFVTIVYMCGGRIMTYIDVPSIIFVVLIPAAIAFASWPVRDIGRAFTAPFDPKAGKAELAKSAQFMENLRRWSLYAAALGALIGLVAILVFMTGFDSDRLGKNLGVMLLVLTTSLLLILTFVLPLESLAKRRLAELIQ